MSGGKYRFTLRLAEQVKTMVGWGVDPLRGWGVGRTPVNAEAVLRAGMREVNSTPTPTPTQRPTQQDGQMLTDDDNLGGTNVKRL